MITCFTTKGCIKAQSSSSWNTSQYGVCGILPQPPTPLLKPLACWPVRHSPHHTTVFGSVLTGGMSCLSFARLEPAQSLWLSESASDTDKIAPEVTYSSVLSPIPEISEHREGRSCWAQEVKLSDPLRSHMVYVNTLTLIKGVSLEGWLSRGVNCVHL